MTGEEERRLGSSQGGVPAIRLGGSSSLLLLNCRPAGRSCWRTFREAGLSPPPVRRPGRIPGTFDLLFREGRIGALGHPAPAPGDEVVDIAGAFLVPGLIDAHVHLGLGEPGSRVPGEERVLIAAPASREHAHGPAGRSVLTLFRKGMQRPPEGNAETPGPASSVLARNMRATLQCGISAVRDLGPRVPAPWEGNGCRPGHPVGPRVFSAGHALTRQGCYGAFLGRALAPGADPVPLVEEELVRGARVIKVITSGTVDFARRTVGAPFFSQAELAAMVQAAARAGVPVAAHANGPEAIAAAVAAGVASIEHGIFNTEQNLRAMAERGVSWVPTLAAVAALLPGRQSSRLPAVFHSYLASVGRGRELGVTVVAGTDSGCPGVPHNSLAAEISWLRQAGFSNQEVYESVTEAPAVLLGIAEGYGRLSIGAATDLAWFSGDPCRGGPWPELRGLVMSGGLVSPASLRP